MAHPEKIIMIGQFTKPFGLQGWIKVKSFTDPEAQFLQYNQYLIEGPDGFTPLQYDNRKEQSNQVLIHMKGCNTPEEAQQLYSGKQIAIPRDELPETEADEYYWHQLEGLKVINHKGIELGTVDHLINTGANDVLVVKGKHPQMIPYLKTVVLEVNLQGKTLTVEWDEDF